MTEWRTIPGLTQYQLAVRFKASQAQINNIVLGKQRRRAA